MAEALANSRRRGEIVGPSRTACRGFILAHEVPIGRSTPSLLTPYRDHGAVMITLHHKVGCTIACHLPQHFLFLLPPPQSTHSHWCSDRSRVEFGALFDAWAKSSLCVWCICMFSGGRGVCPDGHRGA
eukprot:5070805-Amphidinium_carterae.1